MESYLDMYYEMLNQVTMLVEQGDFASARKLLQEADKIRETEGE